MKSIRALLLLLSAPALMIAVPAAASPPEIVAVKVTPSGEGRYRFDVTLRHEDTGWKHYADQWDVLAPDGTVLGERVLLHPHVDEQPFTRSLAGVRIPPGIGEVFIRAKDNVTGYARKQYRVTVPR